MAAICCFVRLEAYHVPVLPAFVVQIVANFSARLREQLYRKVQGFSMAEINKFNTASLITRTTNDVQQD